MSYYKQIDGVKYDRGLLEKAEEYLKSGGVISFAEAKDLWEDAQDGKGVTECERRTLEYVLQNQKWSDKGKKLMEQLLEGEEPDDLIAKQKATKHLKKAEDDQKEKDAAEKAAAKEASDKKQKADEAAGSHSKANDALKKAKAEEEAAEKALQEKKKAHEAAKKKVAEEEGKAKKAKEEHNAANESHKKAKAEKEASDKHAAEKKTAHESVDKKEPPAKKAKTETTAPVKSYYKVIDGKKYDRELLDLAEKDTESAGVISYAEAQELWECAQDGKGVTQIERDTLEYTMKNFKYTDKAAEYMKKQLAA